MRHDTDDDEDDWDEGEDDDGYVPCPYCGKPMYEEAGYCTACDRWISHEDTPRKPCPLWVAVGVLICLACLVRGALRVC